MPKKALPFVFLLYSFNILAQDNQGKTIPLFFEKVYLHTDREQYLAGEDMWFKAYLVNAQDNRLIGTSSNLYVELIAPGGVIRNHELMRLDDGTGHGDFKLSDSLYAGTYRLRAYTNWMRNFGEAFVFEKEIKIFGGRKTKSRPRILKNQKNDNNIASVALQPVETKPENIDTIQFFPEGGSMVENLEGLVAFKAFDGYGRNLGLRGVIETEGGDKVMDLSCVTGVGAFVFKPLTLTRYYAKGQYANGNPFKIALPQPLQRGFAMHIINADTVVNVTVTADHITSQQLAGKELLLICRNRGHIFKSIKLKFDGASAKVSVSKNELPQGVNCITMYDDSKKPNCERLAYIEKDNVKLLQIAADKSVYAQREKTIITIKAQPKTNLSVSVTDAGIIPDNQLDISSYLNLTSEVRGKIQNPNQYFDVKNPDRKQQLDLLLMTQGWRDFVWRRLADSALRISYLLEKGITINGHVKEVWSEKPAPNLNITMFADSATGTKLFTARSDINGDFFVDGIDMHGLQRFSVNAVNDKGKRKGWVSVDTTTQIRYPVHRILYPPDTLPETKNFTGLLENRVITNKRFSLSDTIRLKEVDIRGRRGLPVGKMYADTSIRITRDNYRYQTLGRYIGMLYSKMRSKLPGVRFKVVFTIDSVPHWRKEDTANVNFFAIPLDQILSVRIRPIYLWGQTSYQQEIQGFTSTGGGEFGTMHFFWVEIAVKAHAFDKFNFHVANLDIDGYYEARTFYMPKYEKPNTRPDLRNTIHWEPNVTTNANGEATITYYNADPKTKIRIVAEGITDKGLPVVATAAYEVK